MRTMRCKILALGLIPVAIMFGGLHNILMAQEEEILTGVIKAVQWHDEGDVIAAILVITTNEEDDEGKLTTYVDEYKILDDRIGQQLFKYDGETVEVAGVFLEEDDGIIYLKVKSYRIIESEEEDPEEEYPNEDEIEEPPQ
jgi:hypothetical protein